MKDKPDFPATSPSGFRVYSWLGLALVLLGVSFLLDTPIHDWVNRHYSVDAEHIMRRISKWGDAPTHLSLGALGALAALACGNRRWALIFLAMLVACAIAGLLNPAVKNLAGRARPNVKTQVGWNGPRFDQRYQSFPSGHTLASSAFFSALFLARRRIGLAFLPLTVVIAASRVGLNAHWLSDVVFAAILGFGCALLAWRLIRLRFTLPNE